MARHRCIRRHGTSVAVKLEAQGAGRSFVFGRCLLPAVLAACVLSLSGQGDLLIGIALPGAKVSFVKTRECQTASRIEEPRLKPQYPHTGLYLDLGHSLGLACPALVARFRADLRVLLADVVV